MRRTVAILFLALSLLVFTRTGLAAGKKADEAAQFWTADRLHTLHIRITAQQWQMMQPTPAKQGRPHLAASAMPRPSTQPSTLPVLAAAPPTTQPTAHREGLPLKPNFYGFQFAYVKAIVECDGVTLNDVGLKQRGNSSYNWSLSGRKRPFKIDFNRFVKGQKFCGLTAFHLNNNAYDPSQLRETLAYQVFRELGVPAPRTTFALVFLTIEGQVQRECLGLYTLVEEIDSKAFLKDHFGSAKGFLLKPWSIRGLPYMGEQWQAYEAHYNSRTDPTPDTARRTIDFIKLINYADDDTFRRRIEDYLNVDQFLRLLAGHVVLANLDTILFTGHNFYMYLNPKDNRFYLMPWDLNLSFANFTTAATLEQHLHLSIMRPHTGEAKIIDRLLAIPQYRQMYRNHITQFIAHSFNPNSFFPRIDAFQTVLAQADAAADAAWKARFAKPTTNPATRPATIPPRPKPQLTGWQGNPAVPLKTFVTRRIESLKAQLDGETNGFQPGPRRPPAPPAAGLRAGKAYGNLPLIAFAILQNADGNCDDELTRAEFSDTIRQFLAAVDPAHKDSPDRAKLTAALKSVLQKAMPPRPADKDNKRPPASQPDYAAHWVSAIMHAANVGTDERITLSETLAAADRAFASADKDKSGKLNGSELLELLDSLAASTPSPGKTAAN